MAAGDRQRRGNDRGCDQELFQADRQELLPQPGVQPGTSRHESRRRSRLADATFSESVRSNMIKPSDPRHSEHGHARRINTTEIL